MQWGTTNGQPDGWSYGVDSFLGFRYFHAGTTTTTLHHQRVPWWFLIIVFSAILFVVWLKTRGGVRAAAAFPVEVAAPHQSKPSG